MLFSVYITEMIFVQNEVLQAAEGATTLPLQENNIVYQTRRSDSSWTSYDQISWNGESKCCKNGTMGL